MLAEYAQDHDLIDKWESKPSNENKSISKEQQDAPQDIKQAKLKTFRTTPVYKNGHKVPRNHQQAQAMDLDRINGNTKWVDAEKLEKNQLFEYETFDDRSHSSSNRAPDGYKKINLHFV